MFDVGFMELALIGVVALLVVGPERLPALARNVGMWVGKLRRMVGQVKADIEREVRADELRKSLEEGKVLREAYESLESAKSDIERAAGGLADTRRTVEDAYAVSSGAPPPDPTGSDLAKAEPAAASSPGQTGPAGAARADTDENVATPAAPRTPATGAEEAKPRDEREAKS